MEEEFPPLRERRGDIPLLLEHFRQELARRNGRDVVGFSRGARHALTAYNWPGNIRELRNAVERMSLLDVDDLPDEIVPLGGDEGDGPHHDGHSGSDQLIGKPLVDVEKHYIQRALELAEGKRGEAAAMLGIGERTLFRKIKEYGLKGG